MTKGEPLSRRTFLKTVAYGSAVALLATVAPVSPSHQRKIEARGLPLSREFQHPPLPQPGEIVAFPDSHTPTHTYFGVVQAVNDLGDRASDGLKEEFANSKRFLRLTKNDGTTVQGGLTSFVDLDKTPLITEFGPDLTIGDLNAMVRNGNYRFPKGLTQGQEYQIQALLAKNLVALNQLGVPKDELAPKSPVSIKMLEEGTMVDVSATANEIVITTPHDIVAGDMQRRIPEQVGSGNFRSGLIELHSFRVAGRSKDEEAVGPGSKPVRLAVTCEEANGSTLDRISTVISASEAITRLEKDYQMPTFSNQLIKQAVMGAENISETQIVEIIKSSSPNAEAATSAYNNLAILHC